MYYFCWDPRTCPPCTLGWSPRPWHWFSAAALKDVKSCLGWGTSVDREGKGHLPDACPFSVLIHQPHSSPPIAHPSATRGQVTTEGSPQGLGLLGTAWPGSHKFHTFPSLTLVLFPAAYLKARLTLFQVCWHQPRLWALVIN